MAGVSAGRTRPLGWTLALVLIALFASHGRWQLTRMDEKQAMLDQADAFVAPARLPAVARASASAVAQMQNQAAAYRLARLAALTAWAEAMLRATYPDRPSGVTARGLVAERFEAEQYALAGAEDAALYVAIEDLRGRVIEYFSALINDLAPVIAVETPLVFPSLFNAWRLYADPSRAAEIVARNAVRHPSFVPKAFTALQR